jgi:cell division septation protein DedD
MSTKALIGIVVVVALLLVVPLVLKGSETEEEESIPDIPYSGKPEVTKLSPANGSTDVSVDLKTMKMHFNVAMDGGMSITGQAPEMDGRPQWSADKKTLTATVSLEPGRLYQFGLNSPSYQNFRDENGVALTPTVWKFTTLNADGSKPKLDGPPQVVSLTPANGASGVSPATKVMTIKFDMPMQPGFSLTGQTPDITATPQWSADKKTLTVSVNLLSNHSYQFGLNSVSYRNFRSAGNKGLEPMIWTFSTSN